MKTHPLCCFHSFQWYLTFYFKLKVKFTGRNSPECLPSAPEHGLYLERPAWVCPQVTLPLFSKWSIIRITSFCYILFSLTKRFPHTSKKTCSINELSTQLSFTQVPVHPSILLDNPKRPTSSHDAANSGITHAGWIISNGRLCFPGWVLLLAKQVCFHTAASLHCLRDNTCSLHMWSHIFTS